MSEISLRKVLEVVRAFAVQEYPGETPEGVTIRFRSKRKVRLPIPADPAAAASSLPVPRAFEPTDFQADMLAALEGRALRTDDLAAAVGCDRRRVHKVNGIKELVEHGWVLHHDKHGYYRPDAPPAELK